MEGTPWPGWLEGQPAAGSRNCSPCWEPRGRCSTRFGCGGPGTSGRRPLLEPSPGVLMRKKATGARVLSEPTSATTLGGARRVSEVELFNPSSGCQRHRLVGTKGAAVRTSQPEVGPALSGKRLSVASLDAASRSADVESSVRLVGVPGKRLADFPGDHPGGPPPAWLAGNGPRCGKHRDYR